MSLPTVILWTICISTIALALTNVAEEMGAGVVIVGLLVVLAMADNRCQRQQVIALLAAQVASSKIPRTSPRGRTPSTGRRQDQSKPSQFWERLVKQLRSANEKGKRSAAQEVAQIYENAKWCPVSIQLQSILEGDPEAEKTVVEIYSNTARGSTMTQYLPCWQKWVDFGLEHNYAIWPPEDRSSVEWFDFEANFDHFALREYARCRDKVFKNGKKRPNTPSRYKQVFDGINHVLHDLFHIKKIETSMLKTMKRSYTRKYERNPVKARPMLGKHLIKLVNTAERMNRPWLTVVADMAVVAWMSSGRWDCIDNINMEKSINYICPVQGPGVDPNGEYWLLFFWQRKTHNVETTTECLTLQDKPLLNPRRRFMNVVNKYNRHNSKKWLPKFKKVWKAQHWEVVDDPHQSMTYSCFLDMFREAMKLAGLEKEFDYQDMSKDTTRKWSLHAFRRGFVTMMRNNGITVRVETIARHGNWSVNSIPCLLAYEESTAEVHVKALKPSIVQALFNDS